MPAFDSAAFDSGAFDSALPVLVDTGVVSAGLAISVFSIGTPAEADITVSVVSAAVFGSGRYALRWSPTCLVGGVDVSARLTGRISVSAAEDSARTASLQLIPTSASQLLAFEGQAITLDVAIISGGGTATYRILTGVVERCEFSPGERVATLSCRDGYQERPLACASAAAVEALLGGLAYPSPGLLPWSDSEPDPSAYFYGLLETLPGATAIDGSGIWRVVPWAIGTPAASFAAGDVLDGSVSVQLPPRSSLPVDIHAALVVRYNRLHATEANITWQAVEPVRYIVDGLPMLPKSTVQAAISGLAGWYTKGEPEIAEPTPGTTMVNVGGVSVPFVVTDETARTSCESLDATLYRRWYQGLEVAYTVTIPMGGSSDRDTSIRDSLVSTFDANEWETTPSSESEIGIYQANGPVVVTPPTGYEGLPLPWPPTNSSVDHAPDILTADLEAAAEHVVAKAVRLAAKGRRQRQVLFSRHIDPRWEIGAVLSVVANGVTATGQLAEFDHVLDLDSGEATTSMTLAVPVGNASATASSATITGYSATVSNIITAPTLGNHVGAHYDTLSSPFPEDDSLQGFLCNASSLSDNYDVAAPVYVTQFRIVMPEISATVRDPLLIEQEMAAVCDIADGSLAITF
jgi:hypothetical protein